jgi:hypothetical protein
MLYRIGFLCAAACLCAAPLGCDSDDTDDGSGGTTSSGSGGGNVGGGGGNAGGAAPGCTDPVDVLCSDQVILQMNLKSAPAPGLINNEQDGTGWISHIDATAGGFGSSDPDSYVYGKFADNGLEKVAISDEDSLDSMDWDIALRRYVARINSGNSGPSCVQGAVVFNPPAYDDLTIVPAGLTFSPDVYFNESCAVIEDGTGLPGSPDTVLSGYWDYTGCVAMSDDIFVLSLADGRQVKLLFTNYYDYTTGAQAECNTTGAVSQQPSGSAEIRMRWAFVQ